MTPSQKQRIPKSILYHMNKLTTHRLASSWILARHVGVGIKKTRKDGAPLQDGEKKKRKKVRKEMYSSYIYKGKFFHVDSFDVLMFYVLSP